MHSRKRNCKEGFCKLKKLEKKNYYILSKKKMAERKYKLKKCVLEKYQHQFIGDMIETNKGFKSNEVDDYERSRKRTSYKM